MGAARKRRERESELAAIAALAESLTIFVTPEVRLAVAALMVRKGLVRP